MSEEKKEMTKEEKIEKEKDLMKEVKELGLSEEDLERVNGGQEDVLENQNSSASVERLLERARDEAQDVR